MKSLGRSQHKVPKNYYLLVLLVPGSAGLLALEGESGRVLRGQQAQQLPGWGGNSLGIQQGGESHHKSIKDSKHWLTFA